MNGPLNGQSKFPDVNTSFCGSEAVEYALPIGMHYAQSPGVMCPVVPEKGRAPPVLEKAVLSFGLALGWHKIGCVGPQCLVFVFVPKAVE